MHSGPSATPEVAPARRPDVRAAEGIVTPEAVLLEFAAAGLGSRTLAFCVDLGIRGLLLSGLTASLTALGLVLDETMAVVISLAGGFGVLFAYPAICETIWHGRTPGKMVLGLRVVTVEGSPVRFRHAAIRSALGLVDFLLGAGAFAVFAALVTRRSQRLGDLAAGTIVIRERQSGGSAAPVVFAPPPGWEPYTHALDVRALRTDTAVLVRAFLLRERSLSVTARTEQASRLAGLVGDEIGTRAPTEHDPAVWLRVVTAAHQARGDGRTLSVSDGVIVGAPPPSRNIAPPAVAIDDQPPAMWGVPDRAGPGGGPGGRLP